ncbi:anoctamin-7 isoform 3-T3 [Morus bassanus]
MQRRRTMDDPHCGLVRQDGRAAHYGSLSEEAIEIPQPSDAALDQKRTANVFSDGCTRIDFVLVWETVPWELSGQQDSHENGDLQNRSATIHRTWRKKFLDKLHAAGILMEKALPRQTSNWSASVLQRLGIPNLMAQEVPNLPLDYYTCPFKANKLHWFLGSDEQDTFFSTSQRHQIGPYKLQPEELAAGSLSQRQVLFLYWASWGKWNKYQPLDHVRKYFGEKVAFYFAWLGFYTGWLLPAAVVGTVVFTVGIFLMFNDVPSQEICTSEEQYWMCPLCKTCPYWQLSKICSMFMAGRLFDHGGTVFFSIFMSLWAVLFLEFWKRTNASLAHHWDCSEFEDIEERPRPQFTAMAPMTIINPITGVEEPYFPKRSHLHRILAGSMVVIMMIAVVVMFVVSIILYRAVVAILLSNSGYFLFVASCSPGGCFIELAQELLVIMVGKQIINNVQELAIPKLKCWWHKHKLLSTKKVGEEGESVLVEQAPWVMDHQLLVFEGLFDEYLEMVLQFGFITIFVAACPLAPLFALLNNWVEIRLDAHKFVCDYRRPVAERAEGIGIWFSILEAITHLAVISNAFLIAFTSDFLPRMYYEYIHDSSLRGYVNFTLAYAPRGFVLQSNTTCRYRAFRDRDGNLTLTYWQLLAIRLGFIITFEHVVFFIGRVIAWLVPDIPEAVEVKVKRERYLAKEALAENKVLLERRETRSKASVTDSAAGRDWETEQFVSS